MANPSQVISMHFFVIGDSYGSHVRNRALAVAKSGHKVSIITPRLSGLTGLDEHNAEGTPGSLGQMIRHYWLIKNCPGDIVHIHYPASLGAWLYVICGRREPMIAIAMGGDVLFEEQPFMPYLARWMTQNVLKRANRITVTGQHMHDAVTAMGIAEEKLLTIRWGIDPSKFRPLPAHNLRLELAIEEDQRVILSPRILKPFYNHHLVIEGMLDILDKIPQALLLIAEVEVDVAYRHSLIENIERLGIGHTVRFIGQIPHERMPEYLNLADVVVGIPPSEGFPQTLLESMACGTPCIVTRLKRLEEVTKNNEGALFVELESKSVADAIIRVISDKKLASHLSKSGLSAVNRIPHFGDDVEHIISESKKLLEISPVHHSSVGIRIAMALILLGLGTRNFLRSCFHQR